MFATIDGSMNTVEAGDLNDATVCEAPVLGSIASTSALMLEAVLATIRPAAGRAVGWGELAVAVGAAWGAVPPSAPVLPLAAGDEAEQPAMARHPAAARAASRRLVLRVKLLRSTG